MSAGAAMFADSLLTGAMNIIASTEKNDADLYRQRDQQEWNLEQWNRQNAYNTPLKQKERLEAAGINPYSVLAQGGADTGNASSPAQGVQPLPADKPVFNRFGFGEAVLAEKEARLKEIDIEKGNEDLLFYRQKKINELAEQRAVIRERLANAEKMGIDTKYQESELRVLNRSIDALVTQNESTAKMLKISAENEQRRLDDEHKLNEVRQRLEDSNIRINEQNLKKIVRELRRIDEEIILLQKQGKLTDEEAKLRREQQYTEVANRANSRHLVGLAEGNWYHNMINSPTDDAGVSDDGIIPILVGAFLGRGAGNIGRTVVKGFGK